MNAALILLGGLALILITTILDGWAISITWRWFIATTFEIPVLSMAQAIGLGLIIRYLTRQYVKDDREFGEQIIACLLLPVLYVCIGWVVTLFL